MLDGRRLLDFSLHGVHRVRDGKISSMDLVWDAAMLIGKAKYQWNDQTCTLLLLLGAYQRRFWNDQKI